MRNKLFAQLKSVFVRGLHDKVINAYKTNELTASIIIHTII